jgi:hypothetical protein
VLLARGTHSTEADMNSPQDTTRTASDPKSGSRSARPSDKAASADGQQRHASPETGPAGQASRQPGDAPDAMPGRQYQGSGVMNKSGRFGSSQGPEDLGGPGSGSDDSGGKAA